MITDLPPQLPHPELKSGEHHLCNAPKNSDFPTASGYSTARTGKKAYGLLNNFLPNHVPVFISQIEYDTGIIPEQEIIPIAETFRNLFDW